jgi:hypothetical protein
MAAMASIASMALLWFDPHSMALKRVLLMFIGLDFVIIVDDNSYNVLRLPIDIRFLAVWSEEDFKDEGSSAASALDGQ